MVEQFPRVKAVVVGGGSMAEDGSPFKFEDVCLGAVRPVRELLSSRCEQLSLKGNQFTSFGPATKVEVLDMIVCLAAIDSTIPQGSSVLGPKAKALRKCKRLKQCIDLHCIERAYCISMGKLYWDYNGVGGSWGKGPTCTIPCKQPPIPGPTFNRPPPGRPLNPDPGPSRDGGGGQGRMGKVSLVL